MPPFLRRGPCVSSSRGVRDIFRARRCTQGQPVSKRDATRRLAGVQARRASPACRSRERFETGWPVDAAKVARTPRVLGGLGALPAGPASFPPMRGPRVHICGVYARRKPFCRSSRCGASGRPFRQRPEQEGGGGRDAAGPAERGTDRPPSPGSGVASQPRVIPGEGGRAGLRRGVTTQMGRGMGPAKDGGVSAERGPANKSGRTRPGSLSPYSAVCFVWREGVVSINRREDRSIVQKVVVHKWRVERWRAVASDHPPNGSEGWREASTRDFVALV